MRMAFPAMRILLFRASRYSVTVIELVGSGTQAKPTKAWVETVL
jgi:hypothetical protein